ncbi:hypothetical protein EOS93_25070 [Rhizobium sp. RMa-01]|uniref:hypothetical protein n=1 Tax=unclassified Rhizobium TaxID=2613769 RepID=UPI0008DA1856|nr:MULTISPECIES: hypothetical protein [unclassified Rhizobium]OHV24964.1 hypothetical protein BBJ66_22765 [Rhizobium sp. RSm-3]RVU08328.1 hypothetical protein EOS93_25070 [Rhizobium sp. RMa-01]
MSEADLMRHLQRVASTLGARLFRQQTGMGWVGKVERFNMTRKVEVRPGDVVIRNARPFHAGHEGMSDLGGWNPVVVTPEMVGSTIAQYAQAEIKTGTKATAAQMAWINAVNKAGGRAGVVRTEEDLRRVLFGNV